MLSEDGLITGMCQMFLRIWTTKSLPKRCTRHISVTSKLTTLLWLVILTFYVRQAHSDCSIKFDEYINRRKVALRFQILTKLGFSQPPEDTGPAQLPEELINYYNQTVELMEEKYASSKKHCTSSASVEEEADGESGQGEEDDDDVDGYFAQVPMIFDSAKDWDGYKDDYFLSRERYARFYWFNITDLEGRSPKNVAEASLRLYQISNPRQTMEQVISVYKLVKKRNEYVTKHVFTKSFDPQHEGPVTIDVTEVVHGWVRDPDSNHGFEVNVECGAFLPAHPWNNLEIEFADPRGSYTESFKRGDITRRNHQTSDKHPKLIVMLSGDSSKLLSTEGHSRRKRSFHTRRCDDSVATCCKRTLYVNFEADLGWTWIRQPKGFYPNLCAGNCLYIRADINMYNQLVRYQRSTNPNASPSPCCTPLSFKPLTVLFYDREKPKIHTLQDMVVDGCGCR